MASNKQESLWDKLPKAEQERIKKSLQHTADTVPVKSSKPGKGSSFQLKGYVRCELSASDKEAFTSWEVEYTNVQCYEVLIKAADDGYIVKVSPSGVGFQATLSAAETNQEWDGYVLTAHAGHAARAMMLLVFKHEMLMRRDWSAWMADDEETLLR
jgi:hypothetical protein